MQNYMKTILSAVQTWTKGMIKESTADYSENNSNSNNYIKNRTHWTEIGELEILPQRTVSIEESGVPFEFENPVQLNRKYNYNIFFDGENYSCSVLGQEQEPYLGNSELREFGERGEGLPFCFISYEYNNNSFFLYAEAGDHTFSITATGEIVHQIDPKFVPVDATLTKAGQAADSLAVYKAIEEAKKIQPDCLQSDEEAADFIKNLPAKYSIIDQVIFEEEIEANDDLVFLDLEYEPKHNLIKGEYYAVEINDEYVGYEMLNEYDKKQDFPGNISITMQIENALVIHNNSNTKRKITLSGPSLIADNILPYSLSSTAIVRRYGEGEIKYGFSFLDEYGLALQPIENIRKSSKPDFIIPKLSTLNNISTNQVIVADEINENVPISWKMIDLPNLESQELITPEDVDTICGSSIQFADFNEVEF